MTAVVERPLPVRPVDRPEKQQDRRATPDEPGDVPRQHRPRGEQRQHPRRVDVGQERPSRVVGVAAVEPDAHAGPVRSSVGAARLAARQHAGDREGEEQAQEEDRRDPPRVAQARGLPPQGSSEDPCPSSRGLVDHLGEVDHDPTASARRSGDRTESGWLARVGHVGRILARRRRGLVRFGRGPRARRYPHRHRNVERREAV